MNPKLSKKRGWKQMLSFMLALIMVFTLLPVGSITAYAEESSSIQISGSGTKEDPYIIKSSQELIDIFKSSTDTKGMYYKLSDDFNDTTEITEPLTGSKNFEGTFDGNGKTVNVNINGNQSYVGLFGSNNGQISNINVAGTISGIYYYVGGICGRNNGQISNINVIGTISGSNYVGGICGENNGQISNINVAGTISGTSDYVGGICGENKKKEENKKNGEIINCSNSATVTGDRYVGGICGSNEQTITGCSNEGSITAKTGYAGGIAGKHGTETEDALEKNCTNSGNVTCDSYKEYIGYNDKEMAYYSANNSFYKVIGKVGNSWHQIHFNDRAFSIRTNRDSLSVGLAPEFVSDGKLLKFTVLINNNSSDIVREAKIIVAGDTEISGCDRSNNKTNANKSIMTMSYDGITFMAFSKDSDFKIVNTDFTNYLSGFDVTQVNEKCDSAYVAQWDIASIIGGDTLTRTFYIGCAEGENISDDDLDKIVESATHSHDWRYSSNGNKVETYCAAKGCTSGTSATNKRMLTLSASDTLYSGNAYAGAAIENKITEITGDVASDITYDGRDGTDYTESKTAPKDVGKYTAKVTIGGQTATADFEIKKADITPTVSLDSWVYGQNATKPVVAGNKENGLVTYYYKQKGADDSTYTEVNIDSDFSNIPVGQYTLKACIGETTNYNAAEAYCDFSVAKNSINVNVSMDGWTYGETAKTPSVAADSNPGNGEVTYTYYVNEGCTDKTTSVNGAASDGAVPKNEGTYYVKAEVKATDNYLGGSAVAQFTIAKKAVTATVTAEDKTYDGTTGVVVSAVISNDDLISGDSITINGLTGTFDDKNAGTGKKVTVDSSKAEYAGTGVENYDITIGTEAMASINKRTAKLDWSNTDLTYTGSEQSVTAEVKNAVSGDNFTLTYESNRKTKVGAYTAKVTAIGNDNYELPSEDNAKTAWKISYLEKGTAKISGTKGDNDWYVTKVIITPEAGYEISANGTDWNTFLEYEAQGSQTAEYYLKELATGFISDKKTADFKIDTELPTGEIKIKDNGFTEFLNAITFRYFFKKTVDVKITGADTTSGIAKIEYQKVAKGASFDKDGIWTENKPFSITANDKSAIYARITDKAGHSAIINSDGIVVYTAAIATAEEIFTKTSTADVTTGINVNGNTIASVMVENADDESAVATQVDASGYEIKEDKLVLKASYLKTLAAGTYTFTVSYNPYGEAYTADSKGDAPDTSVITLTVNKAIGSITDVSDISKVYDGNAVTAPTFNTTNDRGTDDANVEVEYKKQNAEDSTYTTESPKNSGDYVVRITVKADEDYNTVVTTKAFSIHKKEMEISTVGYTGTYDGQAHGITVNVTDPADSEASHVKVVYGTKDADGKITYSEEPVTYKDAGEYTVYYKVTADNYEDADGSAVIKIVPKTVSLVWSDTEFTYDGKAHKPAAKVNDNDIIDSDSVEVTVDAEQTNAGSYTAQAVAVSNGNYALGADVSTAFVIRKAAATVTVDNATKHIGKDDPKFIYNVTGLVTGEALNDITVARAEGEAAGNYDITATAKDGSNTNYDVTFVAGKLTIEDHIKAETPVEENRVESNCTKDGSYDEVYYCIVDDCKAELERVHKTIPAIGHKYGTPVFTWSDDYSTAEAAFTCENDKTHVETVKAKVTPETVDATCEVAGKTVYTATVEFEGKTYTDSKETEIKAIGHKYGTPVFTWSEDYSTAEATFTCENDKTHVETVKAAVTSKTTDATCTKVGKIVYTAIVEFEGKTYTDSKKVEIPAIGHKYGAPVFTWSDDYSTAEVTFTCENDKTHVETADAKVTSETVAAICEAPGKITYTATVEFNGKTYTDSKETEIKAIGHKYGEPVFTWSKDYSTATATFTCANDKTHVKKVDVKITSETVDATCTTEGTVTYTASVIVEGKTYTDSKVVNGVALGHKYGEPEFTWSKDCSTAEATFTCENDKTHVKTVKAAVTSKTTDATCTKAGKTVNTATVEFEGKTYTDSKETEIKAIGHKYGTPVFTWTDDYSTATATFTCENDKTHVETVKAKVTSQTVAATCETAGKITYTASLEFNGKTYTDSKEVEIPAIGHKYGEPVFTWSKDYSTARATFMCENDKTHVKKVDAKITSKITDATCTKAGKTVYTATIEFDGKTYTDSKEIEIKAKGHKYGEPEFTWSKDYSTVEATFTCENDKTHVETVKAAVTSKTTDATCTKAGKKVYTATAEFEGKTYTDSKETEIKAIGHKYGTPVFTWSDDYSTAKATFTCENDNAHVLVKECVVASKSVEATCTKAGKTVYTATVEFEGKIYTDSKETEIKAIGHKYGTPVFTWSKDYSTAEATFTCENDKNHLETVKAKVTSETVAATCETAGKTVYTATAEFEGKTYTDSKETEIKAKGHKYGTPVFTWSDDYSTAETTFTCANDKTHVETVKAAVTSKTTDATCTEAGKTVYTATAEFEGKIYTETKETDIPELGHSWSEWVNVGSQEKSTCSRCGQVKYRNIDADDTGKVEKDAEVAPNSPVEEAALDNKHDDLIAAKGILTPEDKAAIEGGASARIWIEVSATENLAEADEQKIKAKAINIMGSDISNVVYFNIDMFKSVTKDGVSKKSQITEPGTDIEISVSLPESLIQTDSTISRAYKIIRLHDGIVDSFDAEFDKETGTLKFVTDRFSTYAIAFTDTQLATNITLTPESAILTKKGETVQLIATVTPENTLDKKVIWSSSDSSVATVDANGLVTAVSNGTVIITATTEEGGKTATTKITVNIPSDSDSKNIDDNVGNNNNNSDGKSNGKANANASITEKNKNSNNQKLTSSKTGDSSDVTLWTTVFALSLAGVIDLLARMKKYKR